MKRIFFLAVAALTSVLNLQAQSLEDGKKFMYYERYASAKEEFSKLVAAKPADAAASYWLGQAYISLGDVAKAKEVYQQALQAKASEPLLLVGMGHIELLENKTADARNRFETALSLSKSKDIEVLHAIGRANTYAKAGDANYGISKLTLATTLKGFKDAAVYVTMSDAYFKKLNDGGNAVLSLNNALNLNPKLAAARHKEGLIYKTQNNREVFMPAFENAIELDPAYAPAYFSLYLYWFERDVTKAADYLNKYIAHVDPDLQNEYYKIDLKYVSGNYQEAIDEANLLINKIGVDIIKPRIYRLLAYSYKSLSDFSSALKSADDFFNREKPEEIVPKDYVLYADILAKIKGSESKAYEWYEKAMNADTSEQNKTAFLQKAADLAKEQKDKQGIAYWLTKQFQTRKNPNNLDIYNLGRAYFDAGAEKFDYYNKADSTFATYTEKYPTQPVGFYWRGRINWIIDSNYVSGAANPHFEKFVELATTSPDSLTFRPQVKVAYRYFFSYNYIKKDYKTALDFCDKILLIDPNDREFNEYKRQLSGIKQPQQQQTPAPGNKPAANRPSGAGAPR